MSLKQLMKMVPPPVSPLQAGPSSNRDKSEKGLKTPLPDSYIEYALEYGSGGFTNGYMGFLRILNPLAKDYVKIVKEELKIKREYREQEGEEEFEYQVYPKKPGVLPVGANDFATLYYLVDGEPEKWPIVIQPHEDPEFTRYDLSLPDFLARLFDPAQHTPPWRKNWSREGLVFEPTTLELPKPKKYRSLYQLFEDNGHKSDFWATSDILETTGNRLYHVRSIDGRKDSDVGSDIENYSKLPIIIDSYEGEKLEEENVSLKLDGLDQAYWMVKTPPWYKG